MLARNLTRPWPRAWRTKGMWGNRHHGYAWARDMRLKAVSHNQEHQRHNRVAADRIHRRQPERTTVGVVLGCRFRGRPCRHAVHAWWFLALYGHHRFFPLAGQSKNRRPWHTARLRRKSSRQTTQYEPAGCQRFNYGSDY